MKQPKLVGTLLALLATAMACFAFVPNYSAGLVQTPETNELRKPGPQKSEAQTTSPVDLLSRLAQPGSAASAAPAFNGLKRITSSGSTFWGTVSQPIDNWNVMYNVSFNGQISALYNVPEADVRSAILKDGKIYLFNGSHPYGLNHSTYAVIDAATGNVIKEIDRGYDKNQWIHSAAYDPVNDKAYAYSFDENGYMQTFCTLDLETCEMEPICDNDPTLAPATLFAYCPKDGKFYGMTYTGRFGEIDLSTGQVINSKAFDYNYMPTTYDRNITWSPYDDAFIMVQGAKNGKTNVIAIDPETKKVTLKGQLDGEYAFSMLLCPDQQPISSDPASPEIVSINFEKASLSGNAVIKMPALTFGGEPMSGAASLNVKIDGNLGETIETTCGEEVTVELKNLEEGYHTFVFNVIKDGAEGAPVARQLMVGNDTPVAPTNVTLTTTTLTWNPVTAGIHSGYVDTQSMKYNVYINGELKTPQPIAATTYDVTLPDAPMTVYRAEIEAVCSGKISGKTASNRVAYGSARNLPLSMQPTEDDFAMCTIADANNDGKTFYFETAKQSFTYKFNKNVSADDWLFLPKCIFPSKEALYKFSVYAENRIYDEQFEVCYGTSPTPEAMTVFLEKQLVSNDTFGMFEKYFTVPEAGEYYIGIHCVSEKYQNALDLTQITVENSGLQYNAPITVSDLSASAFEKGELKAKATFTLPSFDASNNELPATTILKAVVKSQAGEGSVEGKPGETVSADVVTEQGFNDLSVVVYNGEIKGIETTVNVYTGIDTPGMITNVEMTCTADNLAATITWDPPTVGINGGYIDPDNLIYSYAYFTPLGWQLQGDCGSKPHVSLSVKDGTPLSTILIGFVARSIAGQYNFVAPIMGSLGLPTQLPMQDDFEGLMVHHDPITTKTTITNTMLTDPATLVADITSNNNCAFYCNINSNSEKNDVVSLPKFSTKGSGNTRLKMHVYEGTLSAPAKIYVSAFNQEKVLVDSITVTDTNGWKEINYILPEQFNNQQWVEISFDVNYNENGGHYLIIDEYSVKKANDFDLCATGIDNAGVFTVGKEHQISATVRNIGEKDQPLGNVELHVTCDGETTILKPQNCDDATLNEDESITLTFNYTPENAAEDAELKLVIVNDDANQDNNTFSIPATMVNGSFPIVTDLQGEVTPDEKPSLSWSTPQIKRQTKESFEDFNDFSFSRDMNQFVNFDGDSLATACIGNVNIPNIITPKAFMVVNENDEAISPLQSVMFAHTGSKFLLALCPADGTPANDMLISPEIVGGSDVGFFAKTLSSYYNETIELLYSTTDRNPESFATANSFVCTDETAWTKYKATLPADAKYFAIRYASKQQFGILIDDLTYSSIDADGEIAGFEVMRNRDTNLGLTSMTTFIDNTVDGAQTNSYNVATIMRRNGTMTTGPLSNTVTLATTGIAGLIGEAQNVYGIKGAILITGFSEGSATIATIDGRTVARISLDGSDERIELPAGVYAVDVKSKKYKVLVQ